MKLDTGMGRLGTKDGELAHEAGAAAAAVGLMTHFATADEPGDDYFPAQLERLHRVRRRVAPRTPTCRSTPPTAPRRCASRPRTSTWCAAAIADLRPRPVPGRTPPSAASSRRWRCSPGSPPCAASSRARAPATAAAGARGEPTWVATVPIGYGDGWRRGADQQLRRADPRPPPPARGHGQHGQRDRRPGRRDRRGGGGHGDLIGAQGGERILAEEVARAARTRSTTRSPAASRRGCSRRA